MKGDQGVGSGIGDGESMEQQMDEQQDLHLFSGFPIRLIMVATV